MIWHFAQSSITPPDASTLIDILQYGALGAFVIALIMGWVWSKPSVNQILAERDKTIADRDKTIARLIEERNALNTERKEILKDLIEEHEELNRLIREGRRPNADRSAI